MTEGSARIETDGVPMESVFHPFFFHSLSEYWLGVGDTPRAKVHALQLSETAARPPENAYLGTIASIVAKAAEKAAASASAFGEDSVLCACAVSKNPRLQRGLVPPGNCRSSR